MVIYPYLIPGEMEEMKRSGVDFDPRDYQHTLVVARDMEPVNRTLAYLAGTLAIGSLVTFILGFLVIGRAVSSSLVPIAALSRQVLGRSENQLDSAIIVPGTLPSELVPLAESFDGLLGRVAAVRDRERDFIRHASHELRTPIASLGATVELALSKKREPAEYERFLRDCSKTSADLTELVKRLSALARIGSAGESAKIEPVSLPEILEACLRNFATHGLLTTLDLPETKLLTLADPTLAALIINNLLDNALSYAPEGSTVAIRISRIAGRDELSVSNLASDLPEDPERLFEPLFRRDSSRTETADSHLGIGLTLSREAATAMSGKLTVNRPDVGSIAFVLSLPAAEPL
jgi:two-component system sensor histidine kinase QseC